MCCQDPPPPPDYSALAEGSEEVARIAQETAREQLDWAREQDAMNRELLNRVLDVQLPIQEQAALNAIQDRARYSEVFQGVEDQLVEEARLFASADRQAYEAGRAIQDVGNAYEAQRINAARQLESYGADPSEVHSKALDVGIRTAEAAAKAFAGTSAARRTEDLGRAMRADVINIGRGLPSQVAQSYGTALSAGQGAISGANQTTATSASAMGGALQGYDTALRAYQGAGNLTNMGYQNALSSWELGQQYSPWSAMGNLAGMWLGGGGGNPFRARSGQEGGEVPEDLSFTPGPDDKYPTLLAKGEYVVPAEVVKAKGTEFFDRLKEKYSNKES